MFSKPNNPPAKPPTPTTGPTPATPASSFAPQTAAPAPAPTPAASADPKKGPRVASLVANDITIEGNMSGEGELQVDGVIRGDVRVARLTVGETGHVEGGIYAETAEIRGRVVGSITAKQVRLYGVCYVDGDITHEQLAIESGAFFQGRSLKFQRAPQVQPAPQPAASAPATAPERTLTASSLASGSADAPKDATKNGDASKSAPPTAPI